MSHADAAPLLHGLMAEFETADGLIAATNRARLEGYRAMDAYSPIPIEELSEALDLPRTRLPKLVLLGGSPFHSWPQFIPVTFETTVLGAALSCFVGMWALNKLPMPYHPVFNVPE